MSSFTDEIQKFSPFVHQLPVDAYNRSELYKQQKYDTGVQAVQSYLDSVTGLEVPDKYKPYLQQAASSLQEETGKVAGADFANMQLVNQIGGAASKIIGDKIVQTGLQSAATYKAGLAQMKKDQEDGKLSPDNAWFYTDKQYGEWNKNPDLSVGFNGSYIKHYDIDKDIQEAIKAAHFDSSEWQDVPKNQDGSVNSDVLFEMSKKGLLSGKVNNIVRSVLANPQAAQQLQISGMYNYKDTSPDQLKEMQDKSLKYYQTRAEDIKRDLKVRSAISKDESTKSSQAISEVDKQLQEQTESYNEFIKLLSTNPDAAKVELYKQNYISRNVSNFSWEENSRKIIESPAANMQIKRLNYQLAIGKEQFDEADSNRKFSLDTEKFKLSEKEAFMKQQIAEGKLNADGTPKVLFNLGDVDPNEVAKLGSSSYTETTSKLQDEQSQIQAKLIFQLPIAEYKDLFVYDATTKQYRPNTAKYGSWSKIDPLYRSVIKELQTQHLQGTISNDLKDDAQKWYDLNSEILQRKNNEQEIEGKYKPHIDAIKREIGNPDFASAYIVKNRLPGWEGEKNRLITKYGKDWQSGLGITGNFSGAQDAYEKGSNEDAFDIASKKIGKHPEIATLTAQRETDYRNLQSQQKNYTGTFNAVKDEDKLSINKVYTTIISNLMGDKSKGDWEDLADWTDAEKPNNINNNTYQFYQKDGQYYLQVKRNTGSKFKTSNPIPVKEEVIKQLNLLENQKEKEFNQTFSGFLNNNQWTGTTRDVHSEEANNTAIGRRAIGKYSVGYHLVALNGGWVPYLYVNDKKTGITLGKGIKLDPSAFANSSKLNAEEQYRVSKLGSVLPTQDVLDQLNKLDEEVIEHLIDQKH